MVLATKTMVLYEAKKKGTPTEFIGRKYLKANEVNGCFENDAEPIIIEKPKNVKNKDGQYQRATSKDGQYALFEKVLWLPIEYNGEKCVVCTTQKSSIGFVETIGDYNTKLLRGETMDDDNRVVQRTFTDRLEGNLIFKKEKVEYADGQKYDNYLLTACEEE